MSCLVLQVGIQKELGTFCAQKETLEVWGTPGCVPGPSGEWMLLTSVALEPPR